MLHLTPHPEVHPLFEALGFASGYVAYRRARGSAVDVLADAQRWNILAAAALGALAGSRALALLEQAPRVHLCVSQWLLPGGGKTIVGGLLGGWLAVELTKRILGIRTRTGDLFAVPLCIGICVGRVGCFLAGLSDDTYGIPTSLLWGVDFGDGILRHPTQVYEVLFLALLAIFLQWRRQRPYKSGLIFRLFLSSYLSWRLIIDFLKPQPRLSGLDWIQWACLAGLAGLLASSIASHPALRQIQMDG